MSSQAIYAIDDEERLHVLVLGIGTEGERAVALLREKYQHLEQRQEIQYVVIQPATEPEAEVEDGLILTLDSKRLELNHRHDATPVCLDYLRHCLGERCQQADAIFIIGGSRDEHCLPLANCLANLLAARTISQQRFIVAIISEPEHFELSAQLRQFAQGRAALQRHCDSVIVNSSRQIMESLQQAKLSLNLYFDQETQANVGAFDLFADCFWVPGLICIDFADVYAVVAEMGEGVFTCRRGIGEDRAQQAVDQAIADLQRILGDLNDADIGAVLGEISGLDFSFEEFEKVANTLCAHFNDAIRIKMGSSMAPEASPDELKVRVLAVKNKALCVSSGSI